MLTAIGDTPTDNGLILVDSLLPVVTVYMLVIVTGLAVVLTGVLGIPVLILRQVLVTLGT